jgi:hypothetical protein
MLKLSFTESVALMTPLSGPAKEKVEKQRREANNKFFMKLEYQLTN